MLFAAVQSVANGTKRTSRDLGYLSAFRGKGTSASDCLPITIYEYALTSGSKTIAPPSRCHVVFHTLHAAMKRADHAVAPD
jgi:hypothetical protein